MSEQGNNVNFFKPKTDHAKANMKVIIIMLLVWGGAVFGFQFLLIALGKPVPEATLADFNGAWEKVSAGTAETADQQNLARATLMVLGKNIALKGPHKAVLQNVLTVTVNDLKAAGNDVGLTDEGFDPLLKDILAVSMITEVVSEDPEKSVSVPTVISDEDKEALPEVMDLYLIHNRSALTDNSFLGFPFHYWYTAQFLLILFVGLCWLYCFITDKSNKKYNLEGEDEVEGAPLKEAAAEESAPAKEAAAEEKADEAKDESAEDKPAESEEAQDSDESSDETQEKE